MRGGLLAGGSCILARLAAWGRWLRLQLVAVFDASKLDFGKHVTVEAFLPEWLEADLPDGVTCRSRIEEGDAVPYVMVVEVQPTTGGQFIRSDDAVDVLEFEVHTFTSGLDAEDTAWRISWSIIKLLRDYATRGRRVPGRESFVKAFELMERPRRREDWADSTGPVQYQDLPVGMERFVFQARLVVLHR
nr:MAG TPA: tail completion protein [Caudoviricetes sp.]